MYGNDGKSIPAAFQVLHFIGWKPEKKLDFLWMDGQDYHERLFEIITTDVINHQFFRPTLCHRMLYCKSENFHCWIFSHVLNTTKTNTWNVFNKEYFSYYLVLWAHQFFSNDCYLCYKHGKLWMLQGLQDYSMVIFRTR